MYRLQIAISTYGPDGPSRIAAGQFPAVDGAGYVVSWQNHGGAPLPESLRGRKDMTVVRFDGIGQSLNRNNALAHCTADLVLIADDDVAYSREGLSRALTYMEEQPTTAVFTFIVERPGDRVYPEAEYVFRHNYPPHYHVGGCEIAVRRSLAGALAFHPAFGLNSPDMHGGEDEIFHLTALRRGLECRFAPIVIGSHPHAHTGFGKRMSAETLRAQGCVATLLYPAGFAPRLLLKAVRLHRDSRIPVPRALRYLFSGALRAFRLRLTDRSRLW